MVGHLWVGRRMTWVGHQTSDRLLVKSLGVLTNFSRAQLSTGDMLRAAVTAGTEVG